MKEVTERCIYTEEQLKRRVCYWQRRLRLNDWRIDIVIARGRDFQNEKSNAEINYHLQHKCARVLIIDPIDYDDYYEQDMEWLLVHELLHLHIAGIDEDLDNAKSLIVEQTIESLTYGYIRLLRDKKVVSANGTGKTD